jgi:STE24 endopeptidase
MRFLLPLVFCLAGCLAALAAPTKTGVANASSSQPIQLQVYEPLDPVAATGAYLNSIPPEKRARARAYTEGNHWIWAWGTLIAAAAAFFVLQLGWSRRIRDRVERLSSSNGVRTFAYSAIFLSLFSVLMLPWSVYVGFIRERHYGLSNQTLPAWLADYVMSSGLDLIIGGAAATVLYAIVRKLPRTWPLWGALAGVAFTAFQILIHPVFVAPLFNTFTPLMEGQVRESILAMARANGMHSDNVYVIDESKRSIRINAQVSGLFGTERIALNDNLLSRASLPEIEHAMGHELGHYVLHHSYQDLFTSGILAGALLLLLRGGFGWSVRRWGVRWGVRGIGDVAGLPLLFLLFTLVTAAGSPLTRTLYRVQEVEADIFALNAAREPDGAALLALKLVDFVKLDPSPLEEALFYRAPSPRTRIHHAMVWKAESMRPTNVR